MFLGIFYPVELDVNWADEFLCGEDKRTSASSSIDVILARRN